MPRVHFTRIGILLKMILISSSISIVVVVILCVGTRNVKPIQKVYDTATSNIKSHGRDSGVVFLQPPTVAWTKQESFTWRPMATQGQRTEMEVQTEKHSTLMTDTTLRITLPSTRADAYSKTVDENGHVSTVQNSHLSTVQNYRMVSKTKNAMKDRLVKIDLQKAQPPNVQKKIQQQFHIVGNETAHNVSFLLLMSYMRSGSSMTAELLQQGGDTFFMFEPFWGIYGERHRLSNKICAQNGRHTCTEPQDFYETEQGTILLLTDLFNCKFRHLPVGVLESFAMFYPNTVYNVTKECYPKREKGQLHFVYQKILKTSINKTCFEMMENLCLKTNVRLIKTVRLPVSFADSALRILPKLKIIHLLRDPRGIIHSRQAIRYIDFNPLRPALELLCGSMEKDLNYTASISQIYPHRLILLFYDCLVVNPYQIVRSLFEFLTLRFSQNTMHWISSHMDSKSIIKEEFVTAGNSKAISQNWRRNIDFESVKILDTVCDLVYEELGVSKFSTLSELRNLNISNLVDVSQCSSDSELESWISRY